MSRDRDGLVYCRPSNGTEFAIFEETCWLCRHRIPDDGAPGRLSPPFVHCTWGVLDRFYVSMAFDDKHLSNYHDPDNLDPSTYPATCKRFTRHDDPDVSRDPPKPDLPGQMMLGEDRVIREDDVSAAHCAQEMELTP